MKEVFDFVQGLTLYDEFEYILYSNPEIWKWLQGLVPDDIADGDCPFRKIYGNMKGFETNNYSVKDTIMSFGYNGIKAHSLISALLIYHYPDIKVRDPIQNCPEEILEKFNMDYIGGEHAENLVREIILNFQSEGQKVLKEKIKSAFGITNSRKHPHWVQEPEWPFYQDKPMHFTGESHDAELYKYFFKDIETNTQVIIEQFS